MRERTKEKLDMITFVGVVLALAGFLAWFLTTLPR
jgi:hypothetical protein